MNRFIRLALAMLVLSGTLSVVAAPLSTWTSTARADAEASQGDNETPSEARATSFRGVEGADADSVPGGTLLVVAYAISWLLVFGFLWRLRALHRQNQADLARLAEKVHGESSSD